MAEKRIVYFDKPGSHNTDETLRLALERAKELDIKDIVVASTTGETGVKASKIFKDHNLVVVAHRYGFREPGEWEFKEERKQEIIKNGGKVFAGIHALSGVERSILRKFGTICPVEIIANTLKIFGQGMKVAVEIVIMAADAGLIPIDKEVISIAGTRRGADTAIVVKPAHSHDIFDMEIREIICMPRSKVVQ